VPRHDWFGRSHVHQELQPVHADGLPSGSFVQGAFYEPLIITAEGGLKPVPWLARSWKWSNGNKTLTMNLARGVKWSDGQKLTSADVVYSITAWAARTSSWTGSA
jgi:peptide/nickel transport system substrate-binding protein